MTDKAALLRKMPIFAGMSEAALAGLAEACRESAAAPGDLILREGTSGAEMFLVGRGRVEVVKRAGTAEETALASLGEIARDLCRRLRSMDEVFAGRAF